jgi:hypothetical protein
MAEAYANHLQYADGVFDVLLVRISDVFSFDEMVTLLNQTMFDRLSKSLEGGGVPGLDARPEPDLVDYGKVKLMADAKVHVLRRYTGGTLNIGPFGIFYVSQPLG